MISILYEDNHIIVVSKPVGMLSQSDIKKNYSLYDYVRDYLKQKKQKENVYLAIVHRLDRNTGGILVFSKSSKSAQRLSEQFRERKIKKTYIAITENIPTPGKEGTMLNYIIKDEKKRIAKLSVEKNSKSKLAILEYKLIDIIEYSSKKYYKFLVFPQTGRFHQIRFQFAIHNAPLIGERKYSNNTVVPFPALWAYEIEFIHPTLKKSMRFTLEPPKDWPFKIQI